MVFYEFSCTFVISLQLILVFYVAVYDIAEKPSFMNLS